MIKKEEIHDIIKHLRSFGAIEKQSELNKQMDGTTDGLVYVIKVDDAPKYILKLDQPDAISLVEQFFEACLDAPLLPKLIHTAPDKSYIVYTFLKGSTDYIGGSKAHWLKTVASGLIKHYSSRSMTCFMHSAPHLMI